MEQYTPPQQLEDAANRPLEPTWIGYVPDTGSAVCLFEATLQGLIPHCRRRPYDKEREHCIRSGHVYIYEENSSGIKRWTDGKHWSPSRIVGNFLVYREVEAPEPDPNNNNGGKGGKGKKVKKADRVRKSSTPPANRSNSVYNLGGAGQKENRDITLPDGSILPFDGPNGAQKLLGSLTDTYKFKPDGLVKRTMSFYHGDKAHHLVSYVSLEDHKYGRLALPCLADTFNNIYPRPELINQKWRIPYNEDLGPFTAKYYAPTREELEAQQAMAPPQQQAMMVPQPQAVFHPQLGMAPHDMQPMMQNHPHGLPMAGHRMILPIREHQVHGQQHQHDFAQYPNGGDYDPAVEYAPAVEYRNAPDYANAPEYAHGAYTHIANGEEQPLGPEDSAPRSSIAMAHPGWEARAQASAYANSVAGAYHSPAVQYQSPEMAYSAQDMVYPAPNGAFAEQNGVYEDENVEMAYAGHGAAYPDHDMGLQDNHYFPPAPEGDYPPPAEN